MRSLLIRLRRVALLLGLGLLGLMAAVPARAADPAWDMSQGDPAAKVTVVEYASVSCPICGRWFREVYPAFKAKYIDTGKIHFVTREMLVGGDGEVAIATAGFLTARCAGDANYYKVTDALYLDQPALYANPFGTLMKIAQSVGMSPDRFRACVTDAAGIKALNQRVMTYVKDDHVQGTPTFVVNGKPLETGYHPLSDLDAAIAAAQAAK
ncbi:MAG: thioredoxin domain-containing protein [Caulobacteraceae bacterium]|nr:thioredoxin domain-containing protein [Caulobacteraceae bacterium]